MFENAKWIAANPHKAWYFLSQEKMQPAPYIVKDFDVKIGLKKATVNVVAFGQGVFFVNGKRIPDSFLPTYNASFYKSVYYNTYDITDMLEEGKNRFGAVIANTRCEEAGTVYRNPNSVLIAQLVIEYNDSTIQNILTDSSWRWHYSPTIAYRRRVGDTYDARLEIKDWCKPETDISDWGNTTVWMGAGGKFEPVMCPPQRQMAVLEGKEIAAGVYDFGKNSSGWVRIYVSGNRGETVTIRYAEALAEDKQHIDQHSVWDPYVPGGVHIDRYIMSGEGVEQWEQYFEYHGFRYVEIEGEYESINVEAVVVHTDLSRHSWFKCDNEIINQIYDACNNSILTCCHNNFVDCPQREQNEWTGDALLGCESIIMGFDVYDTLYNWMKVFKDEQRSDGQIPSIMPSGTGGWANNFARGIDWDSAIIHLPYYSYKYTGNSEMVDYMWDSMVKSMSFFYDMSENYLTDFGLGDWLPTDGMTCDVRLTSTAMYYMDAVMMAELAAATGREDKPFLELAQNIKRSFRDAYVENGRITVNHETAISMTIFAGLLNEDECIKEAARLNDIIKTNGYAFIGGTLEIRTVFDVLSKYGYAQTLFETLVNDKVPGFAKMVKTGNGTIAEGLNAKHSLNHYFMCQPVSWCYKALAGVNFKGFGFDNIIISPRFVKGIDEVEAEILGIKVGYYSEKVTVSSPYDFTFVMNGKIEKCEAGVYTFTR